MVILLTEAQAHVNIQTEVYYVCIQVNKKLNIGIAEKPKETRSGMF